ncbi:MAG: hypothetical protein J5988_00390 [Eubacterium sp.]|nr:hypothetical protein [Eubacterium sp.]
MLKRKRKSLAIITSLALLFAGIYQPVNKASANAESVMLTAPASAPETKNINLNVKQGDGSYAIAGINDPSPAPTRSPGPDWADGQGSYVYYGNYASHLETSSPSYESVKWRVLDADTTDYDAGNTNHTMFLFSDKVVTGLGFNGDTANDYSTSDLREFLNATGLPGSYNFLNEAFTEAEKAGIAASTKSASVGNVGSSTLSKDNSGLSGDKVFPLSAEEVTNPAYGFMVPAVISDANSTLELDLDSVVASNYYTGGWWLRSDGGSGNVGYVDYGLSGGLNDTTADTGSIGVAPAINLNLSSVCFTSQAGTAKSSTFAGTTNSNSKEWNLTIAGGTGFAASRTDSGIRKPGEDVTVDISSTGTPDSGVAYTQISAMLVDENNTVAAYGKIGAAGATSATVTLPSGLARGEYTLKVFAEDVNSSLTKNLTDYVSNMVEIPISVGYSVIVRNGAGSHF